MSTQTLLNETDVQQKLSGLPKWSLVDNGLVRTENFPKYMDALDFVYALGHESENNDHHPDITMNFKKVTVRYSTHSAGGITDLDVKMAKIAETLIREVTQETAV
jgi:4a-hydroxytetrahydrobiopterin dehydratase